MSAAFGALLDRGIGHFLSLLEATGTFIAKIFVSRQDNSLDIILVRVDVKEFVLLNRGFHWVRNPINR